MICENHEKFLISSYMVAVMSRFIIYKWNYLTIVQPQSVSDEGLFSVLEGGLQSLGIDRIAVGTATDGAIAASRKATCVGCSGCRVYDSSLRTGSA